MSLYDRIVQDQMNARKNRSEDARILTTLLGELQLHQTVTASGAKVIDDETTLKIIRKFAKNNEEMKRLDPSNETVVAENEVLYRYLPTMITGENLRMIIKAIIEMADGPVNIGYIMSQLKLAINNQFDGKEANQIIKELI